MTRRKQVEDLHRNTRKGRKETAAFKNLRFKRIDISVSFTLGAYTQGETNLEFNPFSTWEASVCQMSIA